MYCNTNYFPVLPFCGPYSKPRGARVFSKHYHLRFYPKIGNGVCAIRHIPCACVTCNTMLEKPWISIIHIFFKNAIKLSPIAPIGQSYSHSTILTSSNCNRNQPLMTHLMK